MGSHQSYVSESVEWYTPPGIFDALGIRFDLDPCAPPGGVPWVPADRHYALPEQDGLVLSWEGRVWLNPPYGRGISAWMRKLSEHRDGIALVFARTDAGWFHETVPSADAVCFIAGRLTFVAGDGRPSRSNSGAPSMLVAYGRECAEAVAAARLGMTFSVLAEPLLGQASLWEHRPERPVA